MEFAFFQSISQLFLPTYFVKCRRTLLELNSYAPYPSTVREIKSRRCLFTSSVKREIRHVHVVVVQKQAEKCRKKAWCTYKVVVLLIKPIVFSTFSLPSALLDLKVPIVTLSETPSQIACFLLSMAAPPLHIIFSIENFS